MKDNARSRQMLILSSFESTLNVNDHVYATSLHSEHVGNHQCQFMDPCPVWEKLNLSVTGGINTIYSTFAGSVSKSTGHFPGT